ncbi:polysaccharide biosynthesis protein [Geoanaerobacter pelophilus]|uniref:Polysaccharide biosynthesis protein n=1 Tax=Geoanaerobacter pelophilus TaxID=60036 RepID=A0ABQ0MFG0_9BACT|nr:oligosaccharide flippase family protein [Geoanaerobacter pelophilus]GAW65835.1 polysaccharide biosynthesis protein [Geoanaerobacter pelophilus]
MSIKQWISYLIARAIPGAINFFAIPLYTRLLSPLEYGKYSIVLTTIGFANIIFFWWLKFSLTRFIHKFDENKRPSLLSSIILCYLCLLLISTLVAIFFYIFILDESVKSLIWIGTLLLWFQGLFELNLEFVRSSLNPTRYSILTIAKAVIGLSTSYFLITQGFQAGGLLIGLIVGFAIPALYQSRQLMREITFKLYESSIILQLLKYGFPLIITFVFSFIVLSSDRYFLGWLAGPKSVGLYSVGYDLAQQSLGFLMSVIYLGSYPRIIRSFERDGVDAARENLSVNLSTLLGVSLPAIVAMTIYAPEIANILVGKDFADFTGKLIPWIVASAFLQGIKAYHIDVCYQLAHYTIGQIYVSFGAAMVNLVLNFVLIKKLGIMGAAYSTLISYVVAITLSLILLKGTFPIPKFKANDYKIVLAAILMSIIMLLVQHLDYANIYLCSISGILVYILTIYSVNAFSLKTRVRYFMKERCRQYAG